MAQTQINQPEVQGTLTSSFITVQNQPQKILVVAQKTASGSATSGELIENVQNNNTTVNGLFGARAQVSGIIRNIRKINTETQVDVIPLDDNGAGVAATKTITVTGTATETGALTFYIGSRQDHSFSVTITSGDLQNDIATAIDTAFGLDAEVPMTSGVSTNVVTLTAANDGTVGNDIGVVVEGSIGGVTIVIADGVTGATDPSFTGVFDPVANIRYQNIVWPYSADLTTILNFINPRFNASGKILDGRAYVGIQDTFSNLETTGNGQNSQNLKFIGDRLISTTIYRGPGMLELTYAKAAQNVAIRSLRLTDEANIANLVIANLGSLDRFGGIHTASLPYFNTPLQFMPLINPNQGFTDDEIEDLFAAGVSVFGNNLNNTQAIMGEQVTTYKTDAAANPDLTFKFENYDDTGRECREYFFNNYKARFNQHRLTQGNVLAGYAMANTDTIRRFSKRLYNELSDLALVVQGELPSGEQGIDFFDRNLIITQTSSTTVTVTMVLPIVTQLRTILYTIEVSIDVFLPAAA